MKTSLPKKYSFLLKISLLLLFSCLLITPYFSTVNSAENYAYPSNDQYKDALKKAVTNNDMNGPGYITFVTNTMVQNFNCLLGGNPCPTEEIAQNSVINKTGQIMAAVYANPPANTGLWLADSISNIGLIPKTYAQGIGFSALSPLLPLWKAARNVSYAILIIVLLVIGLMVMFRKKIDARTVISVQSALPRIVVTLLLITFSYPIAGLMIDLMYVVLFLGINIIAKAVPAVGDVSDLQAMFASGGGISMIWGPIPKGFWVSELLGFASILLLPFGIGAKAGSAVAKVIPALTTQIGKGAVIGEGVAALAGKAGASFFAGTGLLALLVTIAFFFAMMRILFILLNAYIQILVNVIAAPLLLLPGAIPGQPSFSSWLRGLLANLSVFPSTAILLLTANAVAQSFMPCLENWWAPIGLGCTVGGDNYWIPPMLPGFGEDLMHIMIGLGFALMTPQIVLSIKKAFGAKPAIPLSGAASKIIGLPMGIAQQGLNTLYQFRMLKKP